MKRRLYKPTQLTKSFNCCARLNSQGQWQPLLAMLTARVVTPSSRSSSPSVLVPPLQRHSAWSTSLDLSDLIRARSRGSGWRRRWRSIKVWVHSQMSYRRSRTTASMCHIVTQSSLSVCSSSSQARQPKYWWSSILIQSHPMRACARYASPKRSTIASRCQRPKTTEN